jgi:hypothetical protein
MRLRGESRQPASTTLEFWHDLVACERHIRAHPVVHETKATHGIEDSILRESWNFILTCWVVANQLTGENARDPAWAHTMCEQ